MKNEEIKEYNHYGVKVTKQTLWNKRFVNALEENGIDYEMMPVEIPGKAEVFIYTYNSVKKYALVDGVGGVDGFAENVYITTAIPDDMDWPIMARDVDRQENGEEPLKMHTQFQRRLLAAISKVESDHEDMVNDFENFAKAPEEFIPDYWIKVAYEIQSYYSKKEIEKYGHAAWDVMDQTVDQLVNVLM